MAQRAGHHEYAAFGLLWRSSLALPFAHRSGQPKPADVTVRVGKTPAHLPSAASGTPDCWEASPGTALLAVPDVARYLVRRQEIVIEPGGGSEDDIVTFLVGPVAIALLQLRGVATLHAASVDVDGEAVVVLGASGVGKSALARALVARGHALLADNVTGLVPAGGRIAALPAYPRLRLWGDLVAQAARRQPTRDGLKKYWCAAPCTTAQPRPVRAVILLQSHNQEAVDVLRLPVRDAFKALWAHTAGKRLLDALGQRQRHYRAALALAREAPFVRVRRAHHPFQTARLADEVAALAAQIEALVAECQVPPSAVALPSARRHDGATPRAYANRAGTKGAAPDAVWPAVHGRGVVWIVAYPKSGTTWLRAVLTNYLQDQPHAASINALVGDMGVSARDNFDQLIGLDSSDLRADELVRHLPRFRELLADALLAAPADACRDSPGRRVFAKSHEPFEASDGPRFSPIGIACAIYLVRNPLDVAVSYAHHLQEQIEQTVRRMNDPAARDLPAVGGIGKLLPNPLGTWSENVASWLQQSAVPTCVARYEDLLTDPIAGFGRIVRFAGLKWQADRLAHAVEQASFNRLCAQEAEQRFGEGRRTTPTFFRAGVAGGWRDVLTQDQVQALVAAHRPMMARLGYLQEAAKFLATTTPDTVRSPTLVS